MRRAVRALFAVFVLVNAGSVIAAQPAIKIGRISVQMSEGNWQVREGVAFNPNVDRGFNGTVRGESKILVRNDESNQPLAVLAVSATWGRANVELWMPCDQKDGFYVRSLAPGRFNTVACVQFSGPYDGESAVVAGFGDFKEARELAPLAVPPVAYAVSVLMSTDNGTMIVLDGLVASTLVGLPGHSPKERLPEGISKSLAAWADAVGEAAYSAMNSLSGDLAMPSLEFRPKVRTRTAHLLR